MTLIELHILVNQVCPIYGLNSDGRCHFKDEATEADKLEAQKIIDKNISQLEA